MASRSESPSSGFHTTDLKDSNDDIGNLPDVQEPERKPTVIEANVEVQDGSRKVNYKVNISVDKPEELHLATKIVDSYTAILEKTVSQK